MSWHWTCFSPDLPFSMCCPRQNPCFRAAVSRPGAEARPRHHPVLPVSSWCLTPVSQSGQEDVATRPHGEGPSHSGRTGTGVQGWAQASSSLRGGAALRQRPGPMRKAPGRVALGVGRAPTPTPELLVRPLVSCASLGKSLTSLCLGCPTCNMELKITVAALWGGCEH